jgi:hypothetical protein
MVQPRCFSLYEANEVRRSDLIEPNFCRAENTVKKTSDCIAVQEDRGSGESALTQQILLEFLSDATSG